MVFRTAMKATAERLLSGGLPERLGRQRLSERILVLAYHNVVPTGFAPIGDRSLHLPVDELASQLDHLVTVADIVPLAGSLDPEHAPESAGRPKVVLTFDDGYRGALTLGVREIRARGLPATFFIAPGLLGDRTLWWDGLAARERRMPPGVRRYALDELAGSSEEILRWARIRGLDPAPMPPECRTVTERELAALDGLDGVSFGAHSWGHPSLPHLAPDPLLEELTRPLQWLREGFRSAAPWVAYPYGHASSQVRRAASACGYAGSFLVDGGWLPRRPQSSFDLPRLPVPAGISPRGFRARVAGYLCRS